MIPGFDYSMSPAWINNPNYLYESPEKTPEKGKTPHSAILLCNEGFFSEVIYGPSSRTLHSSN